MASDGSGLEAGSVQFMEGFSGGPFFIKTMTHGTTHLAHLELPEKFVRSHGEELGETIVFNVPTGESWNIPLEKARGKVWLGMAWRDFVDRYSLAPGNRVLFVYEGTATFRVVVFDRQEAEIGYPEFASPKVEDTGDDSPVGMTTPGGVTDRVPHHSSAGAPHVPTDRNSAGPSRQLSGGAAAANFQSDFPFFSVTMMKRNYKDYALCVSTIFAETHELEHMEVVNLEHSSRPEPWPVTLLYYPEKFQCYLSGGWSNFRVENNLQHGDTCIFELIRRCPAVFKVTIIRRNS